MKVEFAGCIISGSGTLYKSRNGSRVIVTTRRASTTNKNRVRMYIRSGESYKRTQPFSDAEIAAQELFTRRQAYVKELITNGKCKSRAEAWKIAKKTII